MKKLIAIACLASISSAAPLRVTEDFANITAKAENLEFAKQNRNAYGLQKKNDGANSMFMLRKVNRTYSNNEVLQLSEEFFSGKKIEDTRFADVKHYRDEYGMKSFGHDTKTGMLFYNVKKENAGAKEPADKAWLLEKVSEKLSALGGDVENCFDMSQGGLLVSSNGSSTKVLGRTFHFDRVVQGWQIRGKAAFGNVVIDNNGEVRFLEFNDPQLEVLPIAGKKLKNKDVIERELHSRAAAKKVIKYLDKEVEVKEISIRESYLSMIESPDDASLLVPALTVKTTQALSNGKELNEEWDVELISK